MNKRIVTFFICLVLVTLVGVLAGTLFKVKTIEVTFESDSEQITAGQVIEASNITIGKNIFTVSESKVVGNIQNKIPNLKIINIERKFPNTIIIHTAVRIPVLAIGIAGNNKVVLLDRTMYVIDVIERDELLAYENEIITVNNTVLAGDIGIFIGQQLNPDFGEEIVASQNILVGMEEYALEHNEVEIAKYMVKFIKTISFDDTSMYNPVILETRSGVKFCMPYTNLVNITKLAYTTFNDMKPEQQAGGIAYYKDGIFKY